MVWFTDVLVQPCTCLRLNLIVWQTRQGEDTHRHPAALAETLLMPKPTVTMAEYRTLVEKLV